MMYIDDKDLNYILNKYHDKNGDFSPFSRFICYDGVYDMTTGLNAEKMEQELINYVHTLTETNHTVIKAKAFEFVLSNTPIDVNSHDWFVGIHSTNRTLGKVLTSKWSDEIFNVKLKNIQEKMEFYRGEGVASIWPDYDHSAPDFDYVLPLGFTGMLNKAEEAKLNFKVLNEEQEAFFDSIEIELNSILHLIDRFITFAQKNPSDKSKIIISALNSLRTSAPKTVYEVLLFIYIYFMCSEHVAGLQVRTLGNMDRLLYPYYKTDLENGVSEDEIRTYISYFFMQFVSIDNYWGHPIYFGGTDKNGNSIVNELSYIIFDVYDKMNIRNPKLQVKLAENTPKEFISKILDMIRRGHNSITFMCESGMEKAMLANGFTKEEARCAVITGCHEYATAESVVTAGFYFNLAKIVEYTLFNGCNPLTDKESEIHLGEAEDFKTFEEFMEAYLEYAKYFINDIMEIVNTYEDYYEYINPMPLLSASRKNSIKLAKDAYSCGSIHNNSIALLCFIGSTTNSLMMIKKYVYDKKEITMSELKTALKNNFVGYEKLQLRLKNDYEKYGNNYDEPDAIAKRVLEGTAMLTYGKPNSKKRNGIWINTPHCALQFMRQKDKTGATPDGRCRGEELTKNASPEQGTAREGATAVILSATKFNLELFQGSLPVDIYMHPSATKGEDGLNAMHGLLNVFREKGGHAIQFNILDGEILRKAQKDPDKYRDLQVRVSGWNAYFTTMSSEEQDAYIRQAEAE